MYRILARLIFIIYKSLDAGNGPLQIERLFIVGFYCTNMKETETLTVVDSNLNNIEVGTKMEVTNHHVNEFGLRETITAEPVNSDKIGSHIGSCQFNVTDTKDVLKEIVVGKKSDTIVVSVN